LPPLAASCSFPAAHDSGGEERKGGEGERGREREVKSQREALIFHHPSPPLRWECRQRTVKSGRRDAGFISPIGIDRGLRRSFM